MKDSHELLPAKINDAIRRSYLRGAPCFVGFLDAAGAELAENIAKGDRANYMLFGGYDGAERVYFGVFPDGFLPDGSLFPIVRLTVTDRSGRGFTHRDVLGTLMSEGIERSTVGDILIGSPDSALFVSASVAEHIMAETDKIASCGVTVARSDGGELPEGGGFEERSDTVASARLDCVVAAVCRVSRGKAAELIENGLVSLGGILSEKVTKEVSPGDILTVRRYGKFAVDDLSYKTKKGRTVIKYRKYL